MILIHRHTPAATVSPAPLPQAARKLLKVAGATVGLFLIGAWAGELLWALVAAAMVLGLGDRA